MLMIRIIHQHQVKTLSIMTLSMSSSSISLSNAILMCIIARLLCYILWYFNSNIGSFWTFKCTAVCLLWLKQWMLVCLQGTDLFLMPVFPFQLIMSRRRIPCLDSYLDKVCETPMKFSFLYPYINVFSFSHMRCLPYVYAVTFNHIEAFIHMDFWSSRIYLWAVHISIHCAAWLQFCSYFTWRQLCSNSYLNWPGQHFFMASL